LRSLRFPAAAMFRDVGLFGQRIREFVPVMEDTSF
jgi:hypothetical protein